MTAPIASDLISASTTSTMITTTSATSGTPTAATSATFGGAEMLYRANVQLIPRRGSMPCDMLSSSTVFGTRSNSKTNSNNGGNGGNGGGGGKSSSSSRSSRKKLLRRRSAGGGADILAPIFGDPLDDDDGDDDGISGGGDIADRGAGGEPAASGLSAGADVPCFGEIGDDRQDDSSDAIAAAAFASAARFRLKRGSEVTLTRSGHQRGSGSGGDLEALLSRRRGSLPVEMLSISCSGE